MSMTFWCPDAPYEMKQVPCESPQHGIPCSPEEPCGYCQGGFQTDRVTECPEFNVSNHNGRNLTELLGLGREEYGSLPVKAIPGVLQRIMVVLAKDGARSHLVTETFEVPRGPARIRVAEDTGLPCICTGPRVIEMGNTDELTVYRLRKLQTLLVWAHERNLDVGWG